METLNIVGGARSLAVLLRIGHWPTLYDLRVDPGCLGPRNAALRAAARDLLTLRPAWSSVSACGLSGHGRFACSPKGCGPGGHGAGELAPRTGSRPARSMITFSDGNVVAADDNPSR